MGHTENIKERGSIEAKGLQGKEAFREQEKKGRRPPDTALSFSCPLPCGPR